MAELVDAHGSGPCAARCGGSSPLLGTSTKHGSRKRAIPFFVPRKAKHASRQDSKGIRCSGCRGRACVTESSSGHHNITRLAQAGLFLFRARNSEVPALGTRSSADCPSTTNPSQPPLVRGGAGSVLPLTRRK